MKNKSKNLLHRAILRKTDQKLRHLGLSIEGSVMKKASLLSGRDMERAAAWKFLAELFDFKVGAPGPLLQKKTKNKTPRHASYKAFNETKEWKIMRYRALKLHGAACQCCGKTRKDGVQIHVDHIKPRSRFPELELEISNLQILCEPCNMGKGGEDETDWR